MPAVQCGRRFLVFVLLAVIPVCYYRGSFKDLGLKYSIVVDCFCLCF